MGFTEPSWGAVKGTVYPGAEVVMIHHMLSSAQAAIGAVALLLMVPF